MHTERERIAMVLITTITNLGFLPSCVVVFRQKLYFPGIVGFFTMCVSFMYHLCESVASPVYMRAGQWHKLDNIGAIASFCNVSFYLMANQNKSVTRMLQYTMLLIIVILMEKGPWKLSYTIGPIVLSASLPILKWCVFSKTPPPYDWRMLRRGGIFAVCAFFCFYQGLNERDDYLRMWHGLWHLFTSVFSVYLWQVVRPSKARSRRQLDVWELQSVSMVIRVIRVITALTLIWLVGQMFVTWTLREHCWILMIVRNGSKKKEKKLIALTVDEKNNKK